MNDKKLVILALVAAVMLALAIFVSRTANRYESKSPADSPLIQGLNIADIAAIEIGSATEPVRLVHQDSGFLLASRDNYPASNSSINDLITKCLEIRTSGRITTRPENHADLGVTEGTAKSVVKFLAADGKTITGVVIGADAAETSGYYVRQISSDEVYLSEHKPWIQISAVSYLDKQLFKLEKSAIESVTVTTPDKSYTIARGADGKISLLDIPAEKKLEGNAYERVFSALCDLEFSDVEKFSASDFVFDCSFVSRLTDSTVYTLQIADRDGEKYVVCRAEFTDTTPVTKKQEIESDVELKKKEAKLLARDAAAKFDRTHSGWVYKLPSWQGSNLTKPLADLLEDIAPPAEPASDSTPAAPAQNLPESGAAAP